MSSMIFVGFPDGLSLQQGIGISPSLSAAVYGEIQQKAGMRRSVGGSI